MTGHRFLMEEVGVEKQPQISWQVDSFGVSKGYARLARDLGFDAMFFTRMDTQEKKQKVHDKNKISIWRPAEENFGAQKDILTVMMSQEQGQYCWPKGFAFDQNYKDFIGFNQSDKKTFNAPEKMKHLRFIAEKMIDSEANDHVFLTFGCDFSFT